MVESYATGTRELRIEHVAMKDPVLFADPKAAASVKVGAGAPVTFSQSQGEAAVSPLLLEAGAMVLVLLLGSFLAYYLSAVHKGFVDFLIATDGEMKKVNWSTARDIRMSTLVVIFASLVLAGCLFASDFAFQEFFKTIGVLAALTRARTARAGLAMAGLAMVGSAMVGARQVGMARWWG